MGEEVSFQANELARILAEFLDEFVDGTKKIQVKPTLGYAEINRGFTIEVVDK